MNWLSTRPAGFGLCSTEKKRTHTRLSSSPSRVVRQQNHCKDLLLSHRIKLVRIFFTAKEVTEEWRQNGCQCAIIMSCLTDIQIITNAIIFFLN